MAEGQGSSDTGVRRFFYFTKEKVSSDWKDLAFHLEFEQADIDNIAGRNPDDKSRCMDLLEEWLKCKGERATMEVLMEALSKASLQSTVDGLKKEFPEIPPRLPIVVEILAQVKPTVKTPKQLLNYAKARGFLDITAITDETLGLLEQIKPEIKTIKDLLDTTKAIRKLQETRGVRVTDVKMGSLVFYLQCTDLEGLGELWFMYKRGELDNLLHGSLVSEETLQHLCAETISVKAAINLEDFRKALLYLLNRSVFQERCAPRLPREFPIYQPTHATSDVLRVTLNHLDQEDLPDSWGERHAREMPLQEDGKDHLSSKFDKMQIGDAFLGSIRKHYELRLTKFKPLIWNDNFALTIGDIFTELDFSSAKVKKLDDLFNSSTNGQSRSAARRCILIEAEPGGGKTTFMTKEALDAVSQKTELGKRHDIVLLIRLREVKEGETIEEIVWDQCVDETTEGVDVQSIKTILQRNQSRVLFLLDGYDELQPEARADRQAIPKLLSGKVYPNSTIVITSRPAAGVQQHTQPDCCASIIGFTFRHHCKREGVDMPTDGIPSDLADALLQLGKLALEALLRKETQLDIAEVERQNVNWELMLKLGVVFSEASASKLHPRKQLTFAHKMMQEFLAGRYVASVVLNQDIRDLLKITSMSNVLEHSNLLQFACGSSDSRAAQAVMEGLANLSSKEYEGLQVENITKLDWPWIPKPEVRNDYNAFARLCLGILNENMDPGVLQAVRRALPFMVSHNAINSREHAALKYYIQNIPPSAQSLQQMALEMGGPSQFVTAQVLQFLEQTFPSPTPGLLLDLSMSGIFLGAPELTERLVSVLKHVPGLRRLDLSETYQFAPSLQPIIDAFSHMPMLEELDLSWMELGDAEIEVVQEGLKRLPHLAVLHFKANIYEQEITITAKGMSILAPSMRKLTGLRELDISCNAIGDKGMEHLVDVLPIFTAMQILILAQVGMSITGMRKLVRALRYLTGLLKLDISENHIGDIGLECLADILPGLIAIKVLKLSETGIGDKGMSALVKALPYLMELQVLDVSNNQIGDSEIVALVQTLCRSSTLDIEQTPLGDKRQALVGSHVQELDFSENTGVTAAGLERVSHTITLPALTTLKMSTYPETLTHLPDSSAMAVVEALPRLPALERLHLGYITMDPVGFKAVVQAAEEHPTLRELWYTKEGVPEGADTSAHCLTWSTTLERCADIVDTSKIFFTSLPSRRHDWPICRLQMGSCHGADDARPRLTSAEVTVSLAQSDLRLDVPTKVSTIVGDPVTIPATFRTTRRIMSILWSKSGKENARQPVMSSYPIADTTEAHAGFDTKFSGGTLQNPNLVIRHVTRGDAGRYRCIVDHVIKSASAALNLQVLYAASVISVSDSRTAVISESVTLQCTADGNPPPNVTWTRNGLPVRSSTRSLSRDVRLSSVVLPNVQLNASGTYVCTASNSVGKSDVKSLQLVVEEYSMDEKSSMIAILVGALAGGLWLIICLVLAVYFFRRRREREEKKKFSFYYNMGRRGQETINKKLQEDTLDSGRHPNPQVPAKPMLPTAPNAGIETLRRTKKQRERRYAKAMYPYYPQDDNELCLEIDDVIEVLEGEDGGWCLGYLRGRIGLFPSNYVKFLTAKEASAAKLKDLHEGKDAVKLPTKGSI
uniref:Uncharacterized protein n=1 Tax=Branchiostoma floridae TaxID=7739 RepID=C3XQ80_BRAFL|eukprot:XP_002614092.1 hypothetical protein BRAFLDRAFT_67322 [Branchiostoma floridae]